MTKYECLGVYTAPLKVPEREIVGRDDDINNILATFMRPELCNIMLLGNAGSGKGHTPDTIVPVKDSRSYIKWKDLEIGDILFDENSNETIVEEIFDMGKKRVYGVHFENGSMIKCNDEHLWAVYDGNDSLEVKELKAFMTHEDVFVPLNKPVDKTALSLNFSPYDLGNDLFKKGVGFDIKNLNLIYMSSVSHRLSFIRGICDNGSLDVTNRTLTFRIKSLTAVFYVKKVLWSMGINFRCYGNKFVLLGISKNSSQLFTSQSLLDQIMDIEPLDLDTRLKIVKIEDLGYKDNITCIRVSGDSHLYQVGYEHIVTHNTALAQGAMIKDSKRTYLEVDLARMISDLKEPNELAARLKTLFDEVQVEVKNTNKEIVLFIDEFHQIVQLSAAAVEALKPMLADSGTRRVRVIAATTYDEFRQYVKDNQPLVERFERHDIRQPDEETTVKILRGMAKRYGVLSEFPDDSMFHTIYETTNRHVPASSQPRKSIKILDSMVGWHKLTGEPLDRDLLNKVIYNSEGVNVNFKVDAASIKKKLDEKVIAQDLATTAIADRLQLCCAGMNNKDRPMVSFLFTGSSGVGKTEVTKQLAKLLFDDNRNLHRFDMSEYANADSLERFRTELTARVWERPYSIVLFDEVEKASGAITRVLLQVLDDARLTDQYNREVSFSNTYIILTTNAGYEVYENMAAYDTDSSISQKQRFKEYERLIRTSIIQTQEDNKFPPELLGRINAIIPFSPLTPETKEKILGIKFKSILTELKVKRGITVKVSQRVIKYLVTEDGQDRASEGGARNVVSKMESEVLVELARFINEHPEYKYIKIGVEGTLYSEDKTKRVSDAQISVKFDKATYMKVKEQLRNSSRKLR